DLFESIQPLAALLDRSQAVDLHTEAVKSQRDKVENCTLTPSAQVLEALRKRKLSLARFGLLQSKQHAEYFKGLAGHEQSNLEALSVTSRLHQQALERASIGELDAYVQSYISRISQLHS
ncbi:TPA: glutamate--cysteine ligase, partial [Pseudomonas aeruginosa]|nr:glutamate--cysteine ligase [Pseudomonas aeruginosa]